MITSERAEELAARMQIQFEVCDEIEEADYRDTAVALRKLADLLRVVGPEMPCGCYAVTMRRSWNPELYAKTGSGEYLYCGKHDAEHGVPAEYVEWRAR